MTPINYRQGCQWDDKIERGDTGCCGWCQKCENARATRTTAIRPKPEAAYVAICDYLRTTQD